MSDPETTRALGELSTAVQFVGDSVRDLGTKIDTVATEAFLPYLAGTVASMITGLLCIHLLMGIIRRRRLHWFALYCWLVGGLGLVFLL